MKVTSILSVAGLLATGILSWAVPVIDESSILIDAYTSNDVPTYAATDTPTVSVKIADATAAWVDFTQESGTTRVYLKQSGDTWTAQLPQSRLGSINWRVYATDDETTIASGKILRYEVTDTLPELRYPPLNTWLSSFSGGETTGKIGSWSVNRLRMFLSGILTFPGMANGSSVSSASTLRLNSNIEGGVSTIYFKARNNSTNYVGQLTIELMSNAFVSVLTKTVELPVSDGVNTDFVQYAIPVRSNTGALLTGSYRFRIRNITEVSDPLDMQSSIELTDLYFAPIVPDVEITKATMDYEPGYPSILDPITFRIDVANKHEAFPVSNITPKLIWRQEGGAWKTSVMTNVADRTSGSSGTYAVTLTDHVSGSFEYLYRVDFNGYSPTFKLSENISNSPCSNIGDFSIFTRYDGYFPLDRSPEYHKNFIDHYDNGRNPTYLSFAYDENGFDNDLSHLFDLLNLNDGYPRAIRDPSFEIQGVYTYNTLQAAEGVRRFRSQFDSFGLVPTDTDPAKPSYMAPSYDMQQVGDYTWQAIMSVTNAVDANFSVTSSYRYVENQFDVDRTTWYWGEVNQEETAINPPMSGNVVAYHADSAVQGAAPVRVQIDYNGFLMFRFCTTNGSYQIRRAAWQDFNSWQADEDYYSRSFGLYDTQTFESTLDNRDVTTFSMSPFIDPDESNTPVDDSLRSRAYWNGVLGYNAQVFQEVRRADPTNFEDTTTLNKAYRISSYPFNAGSLETTYTVGGRGRGTFRMRTRVSTDDNRLAVYNGEALANQSNYRVAGRFELTDVSDGEGAGVSVYGYYKDANNYWEARLTQERQLRNKVFNGAYMDDSYARLRVTIYHCENGVRTVVSEYANGFSNNANNDLQRNGALTLCLELATAGSVVTPKAYVYPNSDLKTDAAPGTTLLSVNNTSKPVTVTTSVTSGTVAFNFNDCAGSVIPYVFGKDENVTLNGSLTTAFKAVSTSNVSTEWTYNTDSYYGYANPWTGTTGQNITASPSKLLRVAPRAYYRVKVYRSGKEVSNDFLAPVPSYDADWDEQWDAYHGHQYDQIFYIDSFQWTDVSFPMNFWDDTYVSVQALSDNGTTDANGKSVGMLAIDDIACDEWRGVTLYDEDFGDARNDTRSWIATYAVVAAEGRTGRVYELNRTRANPNEQQAISTPLLEAGVGDILFSYRVDKNPVSFSIDLVSSGGGSATPLHIVENAPVSSTFTSLYVPALTNMSGRLRITMHPTYAEDGSTEVLGTLLIDNLRATDYPNTGSSSWEAYNVLVSPFRNNPTIKFDGASSQFATYRSAVLNDGYDRNTLQNYSFNAMAPNIQTPSIQTGVGEISFWYRASPDNMGKPARIILKVADSPSTPESLWRTLTVDDLNPDSVTYAEQVRDLQALDEITGDTWRLFTAEFYMRDYSLLRICSVVDGAEAVPHNRVMLDNILITEPVRSSIDVGSIVFDPDIPLSTGEVGCKVELVNPRMNPYDISVTLDYYVGTNVWGYQNWKNAPTGHLQFTNQVDSATGLVERYKFASIDRIPRLPVDAVVQYAAVVNYKGTFASPVNSETQERSNNSYWFENPSWYEPVDLNKTFATAERPVSHFWVFSVSTNQVFIHELKPIRYVSNRPVEYSEQFVELMGPEGADISNWTLEMIGFDASNLLVPDLVDYSTKMIQGATFQKDPNDQLGKGWGFWVLGCYDVEKRNQDLYPEDVTKGAENGDNMHYLDLPGAVVLRRSMGATVEKLVYRASGTTESSIGHMIDAGYTNIGTKNRTARVSFARSFEPVDDQLVSTWSTPTSTADVNTIGGSNSIDEEEWIWSVDHIATPVPVPDPPEIGTPAITSFVLNGDNTATITFTVHTTNGIELTASDFNWTLQASGDIAFTAPDSVAISEEITAPADGSVATYSIKVNLASYGKANQVFFRISAVPTAK